MKVQVVQTYNLAFSSSVSIAITKDSYGVPLDGKLFIYLFSFFPVGRGTLLQVSPITAGPFVQVCSGGGNSPQHQH